MNLPINEIFSTVQGEGSFTGTPAVFVRLQYCPVGCPWCFVGDTLISMGTGKPKKIKHVQVGDVVIAFDESTKTFVKKKVTKKFTSKADKLLRVETGAANSSNTAERVYCTPEHPFLVKGRGWVKAVDLKIGDTLLHLPSAEKMRIDNPRHSPDVVYPELTLEQRVAISARTSKTMSRPEVLNMHRNRMLTKNPMKDPAVSLKAFLSRKDRGKKSGVEKRFEILTAGLPVEFVGDGKLVIKHKIPDFVVLGQKKVIEVWDSDSLHAQQRDAVWVERRKNLFASAGYETLFVPMNLAKGSCDHVRGVVSEFINNGEVVTSIIPVEKGPNKRWVALAGRGDFDCEVYNLEVEDCHTYIANSKIVHNCDTKHTWEKKEDNKISFEEMLAKTADAPTWADVEIWRLLDYLSAQPENLIVITGGEPCTYDLTELTTSLVFRGKQPQIETSGTFQVKAHSDTFITLSPKIDMPGGLKVLESVICQANEIKMPVGKLADVQKLRNLLAQSDGFVPAYPTIYLQPLSQNEKATALCIETARQNGWRLSAQLHKYIGVR